MVGAVVFDIGETIVSEERIWTRWAHRLGVRPYEFFAVLGSLIEADRHHREVFEHFSPGFDVEAAMAQDPLLGAFDGDDLYPDARECLQALRDGGLRVGLAGNQPERAEAAVEAMRLPIDFVAASRTWDIEKPDPGFFAKVAEVAGLPAGEIAYVGDRLDNDVLPAVDAGMVAVFIRRGPWGEIHARRPEVSRAHHQVESLLEIPPLFLA